MRFHGRRVFSEQQEDYTWYTWRRLLSDTIIHTDSLHFLFSQNCVRVLQVVIDNGKENILNVSLKGSKTRNLFCVMNCSSPLLCVHPDRRKKNAVPSELDFVFVVFMCAKQYSEIWIAVEITWCRPCRSSLQGADKRRAQRQHVILLSQQQGRDCKSQDWQEN